MSTKLKTVMGLLTLIIVLVVLAPAIAMASDGPVTVQQAGVGAGIIAVIVIGIRILGRKSDGTYVDLGKTNSKTPRGNIAKGSKSNDDR